MPIFSSMKNMGIILSAMAFLTLALLACASAQTADSGLRYARAEIPTPVLNTPDFRSVFGGADGKTLARDAQGLIRAVEFIALPGTVFKIETSYRINGALIYRVVTEDYPPQKTGLYIDSRFVSVSPRPIPPRAKIMPPKRQILEKMISYQGLRYVWGGNIPRGVPEMFRFYPPSERIPPETESLWALHGLDCSGLLYEAANGVTPRNTSDLIHFGKPVAIEGFSPAQIAKKLEPLDLIVWKGHVIYVLDQNSTIESCIACSPSGGVTIRNLQAVLEEVMSARRPANHYPEQTAPQDKPFVIRRWYF